MIQMTRTQFLEGKAKHPVETSVVDSVPKVKSLMKDAQRMTKTESLLRRG